MGSTLLAGQPMRANDPTSSAARAPPRVPDRPEPVAAEQQARLPQPDVVDSDGVEHDAIVELPPPLELEHAERHMSQARTEWAAGKMEMAAMHLREAITDATWALYYTWALRDPWPNNHEAAAL